jgi:hypothetical protein
LRIFIVKNNPCWIGKPISHTNLLFQMRKKSDKIIVSDFPPIFLVGTITSGCDFRLLHIIFFFGGNMLQYFIFNPDIPFFPYDRLTLFYLIKYVIQLMKVSFLIILPSKVSIQYHLEWNQKPRKLLIRFIKSRRKELSREI